VQGLPCSLLAVGPWPQTAQRGPAEPASQAMDSGRGPNSSEELPQRGLLLWRQGNLGCRALRVAEDAGVLSR